MSRVSAAVVVYEGLAKIIPKVHSLQAETQALQLKLKPYS